MLDFSIQKEKQNVQQCKFAGGILPPQLKRYASQRKILFCPVSLLKKHSFVYCLSYFCAAFWAFTAPGPFIQPLHFEIKRVSVCHQTSLPEEHEFQSYFKKQGQESLRPIRKYFLNQICTLINQLPFHREGCDILFQKSSRAISVRWNLSFRTSPEFEPSILCMQQNSLCLLRHSALQEGVVGLGDF